MLGTTPAMISVNLLENKPVDLIVDGVSVTTHRPYTSLEKIPAYIYIFSVLDLLWIVGGGAIPAALAVCAAAMTFRLAGKRNLKAGWKVLLAVFYFAVESVLIIGMSLLVSGFYYR